MRNLLIVDDERNIRLGLRAMIEREFPGGYRIHMAGDGTDAMEIAQRERIEIIITDIRMPGMDGLSFIKRLLDLNVRPVVMILSGYDDFLYAKEAIRHGVKEYLLKPIVRDELFGALQRIEDGLLYLEEMNGRLQEAEQVREALRASTLGNIFMLPDLDEADTAQRCAAAGLDEFDSGYYVGLLKYSGAGQELFKGEEYLRRVLQEQGKLVYFEDKDDHLALVTDHEELFQGLLEHLTRKSPAVFHIGVSERGERIGTIGRCYKQAKHALKYSLLQLHSQAAVIRYETVKDRINTEPLPLEEIRKLANMLGTEREKEMKTLLARLFDVRKLSGMDIDYLEELGSRLNELVFDKVFHVYGEESVEVLKMYRMTGNIYNFATIQDYFHSVESLLFRLNDYIKHIKSIHVEQKEMSKAVQYIHDNYNKDLNMAIVSNHVSLNYSYFSQSFKEYTGESFVHYLKKVRIGKAKELLEKTDYKVYEIGERVGFDNAKQFNRVFRELEGITAMEYRQSQKIMQ
ncbi:response regulator [Paenibacillus tarimensis]